MSIYVIITISPIFYDNNKVFRFCFLRVDLVNMISVFFIVFILKKNYPEKS